MQSLSNEISVPERPNSVPPSLTPHKTVELLREKLGDIEKITALRADDVEVRKWADTTEAILHAGFGKPDGQPHQMTSKFTHAGSLASGDRDSQDGEERQIALFKINIDNANYRKKQCWNRASNSLKFSLPQRRTSPLKRRSSGSRLLIWEKKYLSAMAVLSFGISSRRF
jgi:hypothetical protein